MILAKRLLRIVTLLFIGAVLLCLNGSCSAGLIHPTIQASGQLIYTKPYVTYTDAVTSDQRENIMYGANMWSFALHDGIIIEEIPPWEMIDKMGRKIDGRCQPVILFDVVKSTSKIIKDRDTETKVTTLGLTRFRSCSVTKVWLVEDRLKDEDDFVNIAAHEFGHALGLDHVSSPRAIMHNLYNFGDNAGCITKDDARELCNHYECRVPKVRHCG